jgi:hypothetical protein
LNIVIFVVSIIAILPFFENLIHFINSYILHPNANAFHSMYEDRTAIGIDKYDLTEQRIMQRI